MTYGPPIPTRAISLVCRGMGRSIAFFRNVPDAMGWALRVYGKAWRRELLLWDNVADRQILASQSARI